MMKPLCLLILAVLLASCDSREKRETDDKQQPVATAPDTTATLPPPPAPDSAFLILAGKRIGQVSLGQTAGQISNSLGKPDSGDAAMGKAMAFWFSEAQAGSEPRHMVAVYYTRNNDDGPESLFARQIRVNSPSFKTPENIRVGSTLQSIRKSYIIAPLAYFQNSPQQRILIYDDVAQGIAFEITTPDSTCTAITIHAKGEDITNTYLPLHPNLVKLTE